VTYFGVLKFGTSYLCVKIGQNKTMINISRFTENVDHGFILTMINISRFTVGKQLNIFILVLRFDRLFCLFV
jgi:hypothetical protein